MFFDQSATASNTLAVAGPEYWGESARTVDDAGVAQRFAQVAATRRCGRFVWRAEVAQHDGSRRWRGMVEARLGCETHRLMASALRRATARPAPRSGAGPGSGRWG